MPRQRKARPAEATPIITLEQKLPEIEDRDSYSCPNQHLVKDGKGGYLVKNIRRASKTLLVNQVREEVDKWRNSDYQNPQGISKTSLRLLEWWFEETHRWTDGVDFKYYFAQREAIETIIYLYEVLKIRDAAQLVLKYMDPKAYKEDLFTERRKIEATIRNQRILTRVVPETGLIAQQELPSDDHYRYAIKMATGSGKTLVMGMAVAWSYFHRKFEKDSTLSKTFLIIAPNVIVFARLKEDFENGLVFQDWDLIPNEWKTEWQMTFIMRGETRKTSTEGTLYLTNIHQLYESRQKGDYDDPVNRLLGPKPKDATGSWEEGIHDRIKSHKDLFIINDEAHHVHDIDLEWYKVILNLKDNLKEKYGSNLSLQLDFSATPKDQNGTFFPWIICDYPLAQAIEDRIVKSPLIVHQTDRADPEKYSRASVAYAEWIDIAISRWKEHNDSYQKVGKKPVLFIMAENTRDADDIFDSLKGKVEFKGKGQLLVIHTDKKGEITKKDLEKARVASRQIDRPYNKIRAIVSVLMLREGWDVRNVSVILGLRPFTAKANILPEQSVGRGLRLMKEIGPSYIQILEVIGTQKFEEFVKGLEVEGVGVGYTKETPSLGVFVTPLKIKEKYNIEIPILSPKYTHEFHDLNVGILEGLESNPLNLKVSPKAVAKVELVETLAGKTVSQKQVTISDEMPEINEILTHITNRVCKEARIDGQFAIIYPVVKKYVQNIFFGQLVNINHISIRRSLTDNRNSSAVITTLAKIIGEQTITKIDSRLKSTPLSMVEIDGFYWRRECWDELEKTVFNITPCFNVFERHFARFLDHSEDISKFVKLAETYTKFYIEYINHKGAIAYYYPDFIAGQILDNGQKRMWIIETKGWEQKDVELKDNRAISWCKDASNLTDVEWKYLKVKYNIYKMLTKDFSKFATATFMQFKKLYLRNEKGQERLV